MTHIINGTLIAEEILQLVKRKIQKTFTKINIRPKLTTILIGDNSASKIYIQAKINLFQ